MKELIPEIKKTSNLTLNLYGNSYLKELPEEIKELTNLENLMLSNCELNSLPVGSSKGKKNSFDE